jgi:hypothetical protein
MFFNKFKGIWYSIQAEFHENWENWQFDILFACLQTEQTEQAGYRIGIWILDLAFGIWRLEFGVWDLDFGILDFGIWILDFGFWILRTWNCQL